MQYDRRAGSREPGAGSREPGAGSREPGSRDGRTVCALRTVLVVIRTATTLSRLLDVLPVLADDPRVEVEFTVAPGSAYDDGLPALLESLGARTLPWERALRRTYDLAVTASANGDLHALDAPLVMLPHGAGFNKQNPATAKGTDEASGLSAAQLLRHGKVVPTAIGLGHDEQVGRLRVSCPPAAGRASVIGDPCFDRLRASLPLRDEYRAALGLGAPDGRRLVVLSSTWGEESLLARRPGLAARLLAELPVDEYRVALVLHPNVWARHGPFQVRLWLAAALESGLLLVPPQEGWRAALVAGDCLVGDHGSVTLYGAGVGLPVALAADGGAEVAPGSPMAELVRRAVRLRDGHGLRPQIEELIAAGAGRLGADTAPAGAFGEPGKSLTLLGELLYGHLGLPLPARSPEARPVPPLTLPAAHVRELVVRTSTLARTVAEVAVERFPARLAEPSDPADGTVWHHHRGYEPAPDGIGLAHGAAVILGRPAGPAHEWIDRTLARNPVCRIAGAADGPGTLLLRPRGGPLLRATLRAEPGRPGTADDVAPVLSALHHLLSTGDGHALPNTLRLRAGGTVRTVDLSPG